MDYANLVVVHECGSEIEADLAKGALQAAGIDTMTQADTAGRILASTLTRSRSRGGTQVVEKGWIRKFHTAFYPPVCALVQQLIDEPAIRGHCGAQPPEFFEDHRPIRSASFRSGGLKSALVVRWGGRRFGWLA